MADITPILNSEEVIGGIAAILITMYGVYKKLKSDNVESANQKAEIDIISVLTKQRDDYVALSDRYRESLILTEKEVREIRNALQILEFEKVKLMESLDKKDAELDMLKEIINYLTDTVSVAREVLENSNMPNSIENNENELNN